MTEPDVFVRDEGTLVLFTGSTPEGQAWLADKLDEPMTWGDSYVVEHRYAMDVMIGLYEHGLTAKPE
jgi:hypothetical protein